MVDKCPICNQDLIPFTEGSSTGVRCSHCDYSIVTTYIEPMYEDENIYTVTIEAGNRADKRTLKTVSRITGKNYVQVIQCLNSSPTVIAEGRAADIAEIKSEFDSCGIKYSISPDFPY
ncbi:MAG: hypothetical protein IKE21_01820 [Erysipelotrichaceae bacterium]|nr:hypothetical protein [Erysipelotrichaceae bacterium]